MRSPAIGWKARKTTPNVFEHARDRVCLEFRVACPLYGFLLPIHPTGSEAAEHSHQGVSVDNSLCRPRGLHRFWFESPRESKIVQIARYDLPVTENPPMQLLRQDLGVGLQRYSGAHYEVSRPAIGS